MRILLQKLFTIFFLIFASASLASPNLTSWVAKGENNQNKLQVQLFYPPPVPIVKADAFFRNFEAQNPWLDVHRYIINQDKSALDAFYQQLKQLGVDDYSVPAIFFCNSRWVGFDDAGMSAQNLIRGLNYCYKQVTKKGKLTPSTVNLLNQLANASWFGANIVGKPSPLLFTITMAFTDAFSPCALFCILALFSFLWLHKEPKIMIGFSVLFLLAVMVVHHFQQHHTIFFYEALDRLRIPAVIIGLGLVAYMLTIYFKGSHPHHTSFAIAILVILTAAVIQAYQQLCTPNFSLVFQQWVDTKRLPVFKGRLVEIIYQLLYIIPLALFAFLVIYFREHKIFANSSRLLTYTAWFILFFIGVLLIFYPLGLSYFSLSLAALFLALLTSWLTLKKFSRLK